MTFDEIIKKYGMKEAAFLCHVENGETKEMLAYCDSDGAASQTDEKRYFQIFGRFVFLRIYTDYGDGTDVYIHTADIGKCEDGSYEINGMCGYMRFIAHDDLRVKDLSEDEFREIVESIPD